MTGLSLTRTMYGLPTRDQKVQSTDWVLCMCSLSSQHSLEAMRINSVYWTPNSQVNSMKDDFGPWLSQHGGKAVITGIGPDTRKGKENTMYKVHFASNSKFYFPDAAPISGCSTSIILGSRQNSWRKWIWRGKHNCGYLSPVNSFLLFYKKSVCLCFLCSLHEYLPGEVVQTAISKVVERCYDKYKQFT